MSRHLFNLFFWRMFFFTIYELVEFTGSMVNALRIASWSWLMFWRQSILLTLSCTMMCTKRWEEKSVYNCLIIVLLYVLLLTRTIIFSFYLFLYQVLSFQLCITMWWIYLPVLSARCPHWRRRHLLLRHPSEWTGPQAHLHPGRLQQEKESGWRDMAPGVVFFFQRI